MNICSNFHADICILNIILHPNFGPRIGPGSHALGPVFITSRIEEYMRVLKKRHGLRVQYRTSRLRGYGSGTGPLDTDSRGPVSDPEPRL